MVAWNVSKCDSSEFRVVLERNHMWWHGMLASVIHLNSGLFWKGITCGGMEC